VLISLNWIKEFVNLPNIAPDDLANSFTMTTAEVEDVKTSFEHLKVIKVAQIKSLKPHPEADKLNLVTFDFGGSELKEVVCGAPNVKVGLKVPYAPLGTTLPGGFTLEPKKIRGILSDGMLCSEVELGLGVGAKGLMELPESATIGMSMLEHLKLEADTIIDVDNKSLTHRPDLWGHFGLAREFSAAYELPLSNPYDEKWQQRLEAHFNNAKSPINPKVDKDSCCLAYWGLSVDNVQVGESPAWLKNRLESVGLRSINNIVDISNYVMLELGIPLHIFDRSKIKDNTIHIKRLGSNQNFKTLDEVDRELVAYDTVICDSKEPLVLAGIMGGLSSGVSESTTSIFIEVANWKADEVRKTSTRLGLRTDSSQRYEKSLDSLQCYKTLLRTLDLILKLCPKAQVIGRAEYDGSDLNNIQPLMIKTSFERICRVLGHPVSNDKILSIFRHLDFKVEQMAGELKLTIPTYRTTKDIEFEADIIEEVGRMIGYDNIAPTSPLTEIKTTRFEPTKTMHRKIQDFMVLNANALEVMTYPLTGEKLLEKSQWPDMNQELVLVNALSTDADRMRPSLVPNALNTAAINAKHFESFSFFEIGRSYLPCSKNFSQEKNQLLIGMFNKKETPFLHLLNTVEKLLNYLGISYDLTSENGKFPNTLISREWIGSHPHEYVNVRVMGKFLGVATTIHPLLLRNFKTKGFLSLAVIDLSEFEAREAKDKTQYRSISKFPTSTFDCTVLVEKNKQAALVLEALKSIKLKELVEKKIVDVFSLNDTHNAVTIRTTFEDESKTLEHDFIKSAEESIIQTLNKAGFALRT
jgi:phenylalanyl-tRNA synthetase beta chain